MAEEKTQKRNRLATKTNDFDTGAVTFKFSDDAGEILVKVSDFPADIQSAFTVHGMSQKLGDSYAGDKTCDEARDDINTLIAQLVAGDWKAAREGGGSVKGGKTVRALFRIAERATDWAEAFMGLESITLETVRTWYASQTEELRKTVAASSEVKKELAAMLMEEADIGTSLMG